jgi:hypothetical protein
MKRLLEAAARREKKSISILLERIVTASLQNGLAGEEEEEVVRQAKLHAAAMATIGRLKSGQRDRSTRVRELARRRLRQRHGRARTH